MTREPVLGFNLRVERSQDRQCTQGSVIFQIAYAAATPSSQDHAKATRASPLLIEPALRIFRIVEGERFLRQLERVLRIKHDRELFGARCIFARHDCARMWTVRDAARV